MRDFSKVSPRLWTRKEFKSASDDAKLLYLYFLTSRHQNSSGTYKIPDGYAATDLGWEVPRLQAARGELQGANLIVFDDQEFEIFITGWFKDNPITNPKHFEGCKRLIEEIDSEKVAEAAYSEISEYEDKVINKNR